MENASSGVIGEKFLEWTEGLSVIGSHIAVFEKIRDIPFVIVPEQFGLEDGPADMLSRNGGFCVPKHYLLGLMYRRLGTPVRYCTFTFRWREMDLDYPEELLRQAEKLPVTYHLACKVFIEGMWRLVDATWDSGLKNSGFPVNSVWDGRTDTSNAVKPLEEEMHADIEERERVFAEKLKEYTLPEKLELSRFSMAFNAWLSELRSLCGY